MTETPIDRAHAAMQTDSDDDTRRLAFYERLADSELFLMLESEPEGDSISPRIFETEQGTYVLAFDREERLAAFAGGPAPYAALSGRTLAGMLSGQDLGLGLNLGAAPSEMLIPAEAVAWLHATLSERPEEMQETPEELHPPAGLPERLVAALDIKLATASGLAKLAYLSGVTWKNGRRGHLMALIDPVPGSEPALARAVGEALIFSGLDAGELDVTFLKASDPVSARLARVGLRFDLPEPPKPEGPAAPGMDPDKPPKLR